SRTWRISSDWSWRLPLMSINVAPNAWNIAPCVSVASLLVLPPIPSAKVMPSFWASSAYFSNASQVQPSWASTGPGLAGYIACRSSPFLLNQLIRAQGVLFCVPELLGTAIQPGFFFARYSAVPLGAPFLAINRPMKSSTGSSDSHELCTSQLKKVYMSCPVFACASATPVIISLLPLPVTKSAVTSTLFAPAQVLTCFCMMSLPAGTQWSQNATASLPAAPA